MMGLYTHQLVRMTEMIAMLYKLDNVRELAATASCCLGSGGLTAFLDS
jgi:hypothetical protein